jgi:hypothetical protein
MAMKLNPSAVTLSLLLTLVPTMAAVAQNGPKIIVPVQQTPLDTSVRSIVVNPVPSTLKVNLNLNKGGQNPLYRVGEPIQISLSTNEDAYVYLFSVEADGDVNLILPNRFTGGKEYLRAGEIRTFPSPGARYQFTISPPYGQAQVVAVATKKPMDLDEIASFKQGSGFADVKVKKSTLSGAVNRAIVVEEIPSNQWASSTVFYRVAAY